MNEYTFTVTKKEDSEQYCTYSIIEWREVLEKRISDLFPHATLRSFGGAHATVMVDNKEHQIAYALLFQDSFVR